MIAYALLLLGLIFLYAVLAGNGRAVFKSILGRGQAGNVGVIDSVDLNPGGPDFGP